MHDGNLIMDNPAPRPNGAVPAPDTSAWPTQLEAARQLSTGERTIRRWIDAGRMRSSLRPVKGRKPLVICDPEDVARLRNEIAQPSVLLLGIEPSASPGTSLASLVPAAQPNGEQFAAMLAAVIRAAQPLPQAAPVPWLTLEEAVAASGLTRSWLLAEAVKDSLESRVIVRDMGSYARGGRWRFLRSSLGTP